jgi:zinc protease
MRTEDDPISNTEERLAAAAHISSPYHHPVIGWPDDIKNYQVTDLRPWYETWYAPNNAIITVVGDVNPEDVFASAKKYFGYIKAKTVPNVKPRTEMKPLGERNIIVNLPAKLPYLFMAYNVPSFKTATNKQDVYALEIISSILTSGNSARLNKRLIREQELVTSVNTSYNGFSLYDDLFSLMAIPTAKKTIADVKAELLKQLNDLKTNLVATQELDRVKAILIANKIYEQDNISYQATTLGMLESINLSWRDYDLYLESLKQVTPEQIKATANQYFTIDRLTTAVLQPQEITLG